jgi:hypothetical protein
MPSDLAKLVPSRSSPTLPLPPTGPIRWSAWRKVAVISAIRSGNITFSEACERYDLSEEELSSWQTAFDQGGIARLLLKYQLLRPTRG